MREKKQKARYVRPAARLRKDVQRARLEFVLAVEDYARGGPAEMPKHLHVAFDFIHAAIREDMRPFRDFRAFMQWRGNLGNLAKLRSAREEWEQFGADLAEIFDRSASIGGAHLTADERHEFIGGATRADPALSEEANKSEGLRALDRKIAIDEDRAFVARTVRTLKDCIARDKSGKVLDGILRDYARLLGRPPEGEERNVQCVE